MSINRRIIAVEFYLKRKDTGEVGVLRLCNGAVPIVYEVDLEVEQFNPCLEGTITIGSKLSSFNYDQPLNFLQSAAEIQFMLTDGSEILNLNSWLEDYTWEGNDFIIYKADILIEAIDGEDIIDFGSPYSELEIVHQGRIDSVSVDYDTTIVSVSTTGIGVDLDKPLVEDFYGELISNNTPEMDHAHASGSGNVLTATAGNWVLAGVRYNDLHIQDGPLFFDDPNTPGRVTQVNELTIFYDQVIGGIASIWELHSVFPSGITGRPLPRIYGTCYQIEPDLIDDSTFEYKVSDRTTPGIEVLELRSGGIPWNFVVWYEAFRDNINAETTVGFEGVTISASGNTVTFSGGDVLALGVLPGHLHTWFDGLIDLDLNVSKEVVSATATTIVYVESVSGASDQWGFRQAYPAPGQWSYDGYRGTVHLGGTPLDGEIRVDVRTLDYADMTTAHLVDLLIQEEELTGNAESFALFDIEIPGLIGYQVRDPINRLQALNEILFAAGGWWAETDFNEIIIGTIKEPGFAITQTFDRTNIESCKLSTILQPIYRIRVEYRRNWQPSTQLYDGVIESEREDLSSGGIVATEKVDYDILDRYPRAVDLPLLRTLMLLEEDAIQIRNRLWDAYSVERRVYEIQAFPNLPLTLYDTVLLNYRNVERNCRVVGIVKAIEDNEPWQITLWG